MRYGGFFDVPKKKEKISELEKLMNSSDFWNDVDSANKVVSELSSLKRVVKDSEELNNRVYDLRELFSLGDEESLSIVEQEISTLGKDIDNIELITLLGNIYDKNDCILEVHSGAGGTEACDWASMIYRMYLRYCEKHGFKYEVIDYLDGEEAGIKSASIRIKGDYAYGLLKCEKGIHRLVRLSPFDANHKRHTSFASVLVTPEINEDINIDIDEKDLKIDVFRSSGKGGQGVNTTDSAVRITHLPSKIVVSCQNERSQLQNKEQAMRILKSKLMVIELEKNEEKIKNIQGEQKNIEFGSQIRSYVMHPYSMVKDHRTDYETSNVQAVLDGDLDEFIKCELKRSVYEKN